MSWPLLFLLALLLLFFLFLFLLFVKLALYLMVNKMTEIQLINALRTLELICNQISDSSHDSLHLDTTLINLDLAIDNLRCHISPQWPVLSEVDNND